MSDRIGGELGVMSSLKSQFDRQAGAIESLVTELDASVNNVIGTGWYGPAADKFRDEWQSTFKRNLVALRDALGSAAQEIQARRDALQAAGS
jgi:WXG100 family type VII secretion target